MVVEIKLVCGFDLRGSVDIARIVGSGLALVEDASTEPDCGYSHEYDEGDRQDGCYKLKHCPCPFFKMPSRSSPKDPIDNQKGARFPPPPGSPRTRSGLERELVGDCRFVASADAVGGHGRADFGVVGRESQRDVAGDRADLPGCARSRDGGRSDRSFSQVVVVDERLNGRGVLGIVRAIENVCAGNLLGLVHDGGDVCLERRTRESGSAVEDGCEGQGDDECDRDDSNNQLKHQCFPSLWADQASGFFVQRTSFPSDNSDDWAINLLGQRGF